MRSFLIWMDVVWFKKIWSIVKICSIVNMWNVNEVAVHSEPHVESMQTVELDVSEREREEDWRRSTVLLKIHFNKNCFWGVFYKFY